MNDPIKAASSLVCATVSMVFTLEDANKLFSIGAAAVAILAGAPMAVRTIRKCHREISRFLKCKSS